MRPIAISVSDDRWLWHWRLPISRLPAHSALDAPSLVFPLVAAAKRHSGHVLFAGLGWRGSTTRGCITRAAARYSCKRFDEYRAEFAWKQPDVPVDAAEFAIGLDGLGFSAIVPAPYLPNDLIGPVALAGRAMA
jgi:hypothetical protein